MKRVVASCLMIGLLAGCVEVKTAKKAPREWHQIRYPFGPQGETEPPPPTPPPPPDRGCKWC